MDLKIRIALLIFQIRRPSGRPQGILNIGVALLDGRLRSMPLYKGAPSAIGYRDLMVDLPSDYEWQGQEEVDDNGSVIRPSAVRPILLRSRSERSVGFDIHSNNGSLVAAPTWNAGPKNSSIISISEPVDLPFVIGKGKGKASSVINGAEFRERPRENGKKIRRASSVISVSAYSKNSSFKKTVDDEKEKTEDVKEAADEKPAATPPKEEEKTALVAVGKPITVGKFRKSNSILSSSEIGPSPSELAYMMAERRYPLDNDKESSVLSGWSVDESIEGLKSKLHRWRTELPPLYDHQAGVYSSPSYKSSAHTRSRSDSSASAPGGLFSCFGTICGYECQCIIGQPASPKKRRRSGSRFSSSVGSPTRSSIL